MSFEWPLGLAALALVPIAAAGYLLYDRRRARVAAAFANPALLPNLVARSPSWRRHLAVALLLLALATMLTGFARPHATVSAPREEATIVLVMDISFSMVARDVRPTRLQAARRAARAFLDRVPESYRVGLVAFGTRAQVGAPATDDRDLVREAVARLRPGEGTALGEAIVLALDVARSRPARGRPGSAPARRRPDDPPAALLLLSDGAQTQGQVAPDAAAGRARALGIPVYTVALGTPDGIVERPLQGGFVERIRVPPDPDTLRRVASLSGGEAFSAGDTERLRRVYEELGSRLGRKNERREVTVAFAGAGMVLLLIAGAASALWFRRLP